jgi:hypothetical protein
MKTKHIPFFIVLFVLITLTLSACSTDNNGFVKPNIPVEPADDASLVLKTQWWLTQVAWSAATVPIIGPLIAGILGEMTPENHWVVGGVLILIILGALGGGSAASQK